MSGRFLTAPLLVGVWILACHVDVFGRAFPVAAVAAGALGWIARPPVFRNEPYVNEQPVLEGSEIANERSFYYRYTGLLRTRADLEEHPWVRAGRQIRAQKPKVHVARAVGLEGFFAGPEVHVVDTFGLVDPLLSRLPFDPAKAWRIGHSERSLPAGYQESLISGRNVIADQDLKTYYRALERVVRGPLFTLRRFRTIYYLNTGRYDHLLPDGGAERG
jgi:arabinofuranosyltransferase